MSTNLATRTEVPAGSTLAPGAAASEHARRTTSAGRVRGRSHPAARGVAIAAAAAILVAGLVALSATTTSPSRTAPVRAEHGAAAVAGAVAPAAAPTVLARGMDELNFQNELEMSLLVTR